MWYLRDPWQLSEHQLVFPSALAPLLLLMDGSLDPAGLQATFSQQIGYSIDFDIVENALEQLDEACLLDNDRSQSAIVQQLAEYRAQPFRPPALADLSYPADPQKLTELFKSYGEKDDLNGWVDSPGRGIISPHIDYQRGGEVYAKVWQRAFRRVAEADLVLIFGTDHNSADNLITLTRQAYATPYGILPTDKDLIDKLAKAIGADNAYAGELNHRQEHSIELSAVWLHYVYEQLGQTPVPVIPILCGSFHKFVTNGSHPDDDNLLNALLQTLKEETVGKNVLSVASVDLAHVGPSFGDDFPMDATRREQLRISDKSLLSAITTGDHARFYREIAAVEDKNRICGFSPVHTMLRYMNDPAGQMIAYDHCPADEQNTSLVSICGILLD